jgi:hypothetical protein
VHNTKNTPIFSVQSSRPATVPDPVRTDFPRDKQQYEKKTFVIGAFSMKRCKRAPISFALSVRLQLKIDFRYFHGILYWGLLLKFFDTFQFWLKSCNNGRVIWKLASVQVRNLLTTLSLRIHIFWSEQYF